MATGRNGTVETVEGKRQRVIAEVQSMTPADIVALHHMMFGGRQPQDIPNDLWSFVTRSDPATIARKLQDQQEDASNYKRMAKVLEDENLALRKKLYPEDSSSDFWFTRVVAN